MPKTTHHYSNGEVTVVWKPGVCIHSGNCVRGLGAVFNPGVHPWINVSAATTEQIIAQVKQCPSGALSYFMDKEGPGKEQEKNAG